MVPVTVDGEQVKLAVITYKPDGAGPFPTLIFHHGSTGRGNDPTIFARPYERQVLAEWFTARGWAVLLPSRRGRGGSEGSYDEGFAIDRAYGYSCDPTLSLAGAERALRDIDAITPVILAQPFVDRSKVAVGGQSRGGILSIAWSGRQPASRARRSTSSAAGWVQAVGRQARSTRRSSSEGRPSANRRSGSTARRIRSIPWRTAARISRPSRRPAARARFMNTIRQ